MIGHYNMKYDQIDGKTKITKFKEDPVETSSALARATAIKKFQFGNKHVCPKLLQIHDEKRLDKNRIAYYDHVSKIRERMKE